MSTATANQYYFKARANYPWALEECIENLNYALSTDPEHAAANTLLANVYHYQLRDYKEALALYNKALSAEPEQIDCCYNLCILLINLEEYEEAERLLRFAKTIKGFDNCSYYALKAFAYEHQEQYIEALEMLNAAKMRCFNEDYKTELNQDIERCKEKMELAKKVLYKLI